MSNMLAIAQKELNGVFRVADCLHHHRLLRAGVRLVLLRVDQLLHAGEPADGHAGPGPDQHQHHGDPAAAAERQRRRALRAAADHDAHLRRGKALWHDRAAADLAAHRRADRPRQVPGRRVALRDDAGGHLDSHRHPVHLRQPGMEADRWPAIWDCCSWARRSSRSACSSRA